MGQPPSYYIRPTLGIPSGWARPASVSEQGERMSAQLGGSVMSLNVRTSCHNSTGSELDLVDNLKLSVGNGDIARLPSQLASSLLLTSYQNPV